MKHFYLIQKFLILFQDYGRISFYPSISVLSNASSADHTNFDSSQHQLYQIFSTTENLQLSGNDEILLIENVQDSTELFKILEKQRNGLIFILWSSGMAELEDACKRLHFARKISLNVFVMLISRRTLLELSFVGHEVVVKPIEIQSRLTKQRMNFFGDQLVGTHLDFQNFWSESGNETLIKNGHLGGLDYKVLAYTQDYLNFSLQTIGAFVSPGPGEEKTRKSNKTELTPNWVRISKQVRAELSDFGISSVPLLPQIAKNVRFLTPHTTTREATLVYVMKKGAILNPYGYIFSTRSWICIAVVIFLGFISRLIMSSPAARVDAFVWIVAIVSQQNWEDSEGRKTSQRMLTLTMAVLCLILYTMFCSGLISSLSVGTTQEFKVSDLVRQQYKFGIANNSYLIIGTKEEEPTKGNNVQKSYEFFSGVSSSEIFMNLDSKYPFPTTADGLRQLLTVPRYGFIGPSWTTCIRAASEQPSWNSDRICDELKSLLILEYGVRFSSIFKKDSPYLEFFKIARVTMKERGIDTLFRNRQQSEADVFSPSCKAKETLVSFQLEDVVRPFSILLIGILISFVVLALEILMTSNMKHRLLKKKWAWQILIHPKEPSFT